MSRCTHKGSMISMTMFRLKRKMEANPNSLTYEHEIDDVKKALNKLSAKEISLIKRAMRTYFK